MSARAASRLEELGFTDVDDYVPSKIDWFANGLPREGKAATRVWAGDVVREDVPTCAPRELIREVRERVVAGGYDLCLVLNDQRIVLGLLRGAALSKDPDAEVRDAMELGPETLRPHTEVEELMRSRDNHGVKSWIVTTSHGRLLGLLLRTDAERELAAKAAGEQK